MSWRRKERSPGEEEKGKGGKRKKRGSGRKAPTRSKVELREKKSFGLHGAEVHELVINIQWSTGN